MIGLDGGDWPMVKARGMGLDSLQNLTEMTVTSFPLTSPLALDEAGSPAFHKTAATLFPRHQTHRRSGRLPY